MMERDKAYKKYENPGPGTYAAQKVKVVVTSDDKQMNSFVTKIDRFCPTYAGSTVFKPPTYITNPGPGTHFKSQKFMGLIKSTDAKREMYGEKAHSDLAVVPKQVPPGIPAKKIAQNAYSGLGQDTVGPALYNPNQDASKHVAEKNDFASSKTARKLFEPENKRENVLCSRENPGPGKYENARVDSPKNFNSRGQDAIFLSKVPNCKDTKIRNASLPGPGHYTTKSIKHGDASEIGFQNVPSTDASTIGQPDNANPFMSSTVRGDFWKNELNAPFTKATFNKNPGPGAYLKSKKNEDIKARLLQEETTTVPFGASDERPCNKLIKAPNPGPGSYIDINNPNYSSICKSLSKI